MTVSTNKMATSSSSSKTVVPDAIFFELSPKIVCGVRIVNILVLLVVVVTFILCVIQGSKDSTWYLLAGNTAISAFVGIVVNWWYKGGDLGSEKFWYILIVAVVLIFQCVSTNLYIFKEKQETVVSPTLRPTNSSTEIYTWATFRSTTNKTMVHSFHSTTAHSTTAIPPN